MFGRNSASRTVSLLAVLVAILAVSPLAFGQGGVAVDAQGVLHLKRAADQTGGLSKERISAAKAALNPTVANYSKLRKFSLKRLEQATADKQGVITDEMRYLAGLLRVRYVFYYPETQDIVFAGPAEGWMSDPVGRTVGITSHRPVLQLQDLVVALRMFRPGSEPTQLIGCSIDPTEEGLAAMQKFLQSMGSRSIRPGDTPQIVQGLQTSLGLHTVRIDGVPATTHFAQVMVEADYRMKLIGIGLERPPVRLVSYVDRASAAQVSRNALVRWFFTPDYQCVRTSDDGLAMELVGDGVKLIGENELVSGQGERQAGGKADHASQAFVTSFTKVYPELADRSPVYAELRNLIDLSVVAAYMQQQNLYGKADWKMPFFGDEKQYSVETFDAPKKVATTVNAIVRGNRLMTPVAGGVQIDALMALAPEKRLSDDGKAGKLRQQTKIELAKGQWWWD